MFEKLHLSDPSTLRRIGLTTLCSGALLLSACTGSDTEKPPAAPTEASPTTIDGITYHNNGSRTYTKNIPVLRHANTAYYTDTCKPGMDILETSVTVTTSKATLRNMYTIAANGRCVDGMLTPDDFKTPITKITSQ